jgi:hypothetical protein
VSHSLSKKESTHSLTAKNVPWVVEESTFLQSFQEVADVLLAWHLSGKHQLRMRFEKDDLLLAFLANYLTLFSLDTGWTVVVSFLPMQQVAITLTR